MKIVRIVNRIPVLVMAVAAVVAAGCEHTKSATPLSPSIAGPIEGVVMSAPGPVQPSAGQKVKDTDQPIKLEFSNAGSNSVRPFTHQVQIAVDSSFATVVYAQTGIAPSEDGVVRLVLPARLQPGRQYYWRTKAEDGANASDWSEPVGFEILQPIVIGVPTPLAPISGLRVTSTTPQLRVRNGASSGPHGPLSYQFQASTSPAFTGVVGDSWVPQGSGETVITVPGTPGPDMIVYWRARISDGTNTGSWSKTESYRTPLATPPAPPAGGGGGPPGNGGNCASNNGATIVKCIEANYPQYRRAGVSGSQRHSDMAFLRDRVIEAGICGGLDLAWNLKRGVGPHSIDAIAWRTGGRVEVVDIGLAFDDTSRELRLQWGIVGGPPGYDGYSPRPNCQ